MAVTREDCSGMGALMQAERYVWARFSWQQARDDKGTPRRHVRDAAQNDDTRPETGAPFTALCGIDVTPHPEDTDTARGTCFAATCQVCTVLIAREMDWNAAELGQLSSTFHWSRADVAQLGAAIGMNYSQARRLLAHWAEAAK